MHSYQHNIKTFNNATRHLTRVERSLYRDLIELYYDTEQPLPADDFDRLCRRVLANTEEEKAALQFVLDEFFELTGSVYTHDFCDEVIEKFHSATTAKARAGKASAEARKKKAEAKKRARKEQELTGDEQALNGRSADRQQNPTNQKPETSNQKPLLKNEADASLAQHIFSRVKSVAPRTKEPNFDSWTDDIRLMRERDDLDHETIRRVFDWANTDQFWSTNILSTKTLRKQFPKLEAQMIKKPTGGQSHAARPTFAERHSDTSWADSGH